MNSLSDLLARISGVAYGVAGIAVATLILETLARASKLDAIPTVGSSTWLGSWWAAAKYLTNAPDIIQEGYEKHKSAPFKVAKIYHWIVVFASREHVEELRRAPDDSFSMEDATNDRLQVEYTMGPEICRNRYHVSIVRSQLTRNIGVLYPEMRNEIISAFDDILDLKGNEWKSVLALSSMQQLICRATNRVFVGLPLCRDPEWIDLNIQYTIDVAKGAGIIALFPKFLRPIATRLFTSVHRGQQRGRRLLGPIIEERRRYLNEYGDKWADKPQDFLSWLMEEAEGPELTIKSLTTRMLAMNFAAIHTSSSTLAHALFYLAANPQYVWPLREEVEGIIEKVGWSKAALPEMRKVDSFLRECQRMEGLGALVVMRKALKDFTFSDGTFIPNGTLIAVASRCIHHDEKFLENADVFKPFRFIEMQEEGGEGNKYQFASTSIEYQAFGLGKPACPGRFFAAAELKTMLAHIVMTYDIKLEDGTTHPPSLNFDGSVIPNPNAKVLFRKRVD